MGANERMRWLEQRTLARAKLDKFIPDLSYKTVPEPIAYEK